MISWSMHVGLQSASPRVCLLLSLATQIYFPVRERERGIPNNAFSDEYTGIVLETLLQYIADTWVACQPRVQDSIILLAEFNLVIFPRLPNRQIKNLTKISCYTVLKKIHRI